MILKGEDEKIGVLYSEPGLVTRSIPAMIRAVLRTRWLVNSGERGAIALAAGFGPKGGGPPGARLGPGGDM